MGVTDQQLSLPEEAISQQAAIDEVVPITASRDYARAYPDQVQLTEVTAGYDINAHLPLVWQTLQQVGLAPLSSLLALRPASCYHACL
jgi:hypothetical protein